MQEQVYAANESVSVAPANESLEATANSSDMPLVSDEDVDGKADAFAAIALISLTVLTVVVWLKGL